MSKKKSFAQKVVEAVRDRGTGDVWDDPHRGSNSGTGRSKSKPSKDKGRGPSHKSW